MVVVKPALGIDVSHFQGKINWEEIKQNNITFAYAKATEGHTYVDPKFNLNWKNMSSANIAKGAYHFYTTSSNGITQAQHYINTVKEISKGDLPPVLDLEQGGLMDKVTIEEYQNEVISWLNEVETKFGVKPIIYTNNPFANTYLNKPHFANYVLWIAEVWCKGS
jgi:lysozyme